MMVQITGKLKPLALAEHMHPVVTYCQTLPDLRSSGFAAVILTHIFNCHMSGKRSFTRAQWFVTAAEGGDAGRWHGQRSYLPTVTELLQCQ